MPARLGRVTMVNTSDHGGGAEQVALSLLDGFRAAGIETTLAVGAKHGNHPHVIRFDHSPGIDYGSYSKLHRRASLGLRRALDRRLGHEDFNYPYSQRVLELTQASPDLVLCHNLHGGYFDLRALPRLSHQVPVVLMLHDSWLFTGHCAWSAGCHRWEIGCGSCPDLLTPPAIQRDATKGNWHRKRELLAASRLFVVAPSRWALDRARRSVLADGMVDSVVVPHGIDLGVFKPGDRSESRRAAEVPQDATVLLFVANGGANSPYKDFKTLRAAMTTIAGERPDLACELIVIGAEGPSELIGANARIRHLPYCDSRQVLANYYRAADIYVHASQEEAFSLTAAEALACGTPVVAASDGGIAEVVQHGRTGLLTPPRDSRALATAVLELIDNRDRRQAMSDAAVAHARSSFDRDVMIERLSGWCADLVAQWESAHGYRGRPDTSAGGPGSRMDKEPVHSAQDRLQVISQLDAERELQMRSAQERLGSIERLSEEAAALRKALLQARLEIEALDQERRVQTEAARERLELLNRLASRGDSREQRDDTP